ncbi:MAG: two-component sensor histidine kinase, partial [Myxococcales bacterium]|nr:two-component sensor histidine kinase [Myxococcales bacterium]
MLIVGCAGALIMLMASLVFWRLSLRFEAAEQREAQQRQLAALGEMSAVLAHELRNPLASLKGHAQLLEERLVADGLEQRTLRKAGRVVAEAERLEQLTHGLLAFVRVGELSREPVDPREVVVAALQDLDGERVDLDMDEAPERWSLDRQR